MGVRMKPSGIGGQAVIEGVMMKNKDEYAVAVRKPDHEIIVDKKSYSGLASKGIFKIPFLRGVASFVDSMVLGVKILEYSASFFEDDEPEEQEKNKKNDKKNANKKNIEQKVAKKKKSNQTKVEHKKVESKNNKNHKKDVKEEKNNEEPKGLGAFFMAFTVILSLVISISVFVVLPYFLSQLLASNIESTFLQGLIEGVIRLLIFIGYVLAVSQMKDIKRMFMYHGAEHKSINCIENGFELTVENVKWQSKEHKRCGTSFMLYVMFLSVLVFSLIRVETVWMRIAYRLLLLPVIAGISYEFIRFAGRSESKVMNIFSKPGLWMQALTTKEPDEDMIEVAIRAVEEVFDWQTFIADQDDTSTNKNEDKEDVSQVTAATTELEEEDDEILAALDKYFINKEE